MKKKAFYIAKLIFLNLLMIYASVIFYELIDIYLIRPTNSTGEFEAYFIVPTLLVAFFVIAMSKKLWRYGAGYTALFISGSMFLFFFLNNSLASKGQYESFSLRPGIFSKGADISVYSNDWGGSIETTLEKQLHVDSVQVRVDKGLFGLLILSDDVRIVPSTNCALISQDTALLRKSHYSRGYELTEKRCFSAAIQEYTSCIEEDPLAAICYYDRALVFMVREEYEKALADLLTALAIRGGKIGPDAPELNRVIQRDQYIDEMLEKLEKKDLKGFTEDLDRIESTYDYKRFESRIKYCTEKLKEN